MAEFKHQHSAGLWTGLRGHGAVVMTALGIRVWSKNSISIHQLLIGVC